MSERTLVGGPLDGEKREVYASLRVPMSGWEYGWKHICGHRACIAIGRYDREGNWQEPERDRLLDDYCSLCETYGRSSVVMLKGEDDE
jgi:hypothetical protein